MSNDNLFIDYSRRTEQNSGQSGRLYREGSISQPVSETCRLGGRVISTMSWPPKVDDKDDSLTDEEIIEEVWGRA